MWQQTLLDLIMMCHIERLGFLPKIMLSSEKPSQEERRQSVIEITNSLFPMEKIKRLEERRKSAPNDTSGRIGMSFSSGASNAERIVKHINMLLADVETVQEKLPLELEGPNSFFALSRDGVLTCELINVLVPGLLKISKVHRNFTNPARAQFLMLENQAMALQACRKLGCRVVNLGPCDLIAGKSYLILGILWQIIKRGMVERVKRDLGPSALSGALVLRQQQVPENGSAQSRIDDGDEANEDADAKEVIIQLVNDQVTHVEEGSECWALAPVENLQDDLTDGHVLARLLADAGCEEETCRQIVCVSNPYHRADAIVEAGRDLLGPMCMLESRDIVQGNEQMMLVFLAALLRKAMDRRRRAEEEYVSDIRIESDTIDLDNKIRDLEAEVERLQKENESQADLLVSLEAQLDAERSPLMASFSALSLGQPPSPTDLVMNGGELPDSILRDNTERKINIYIPTDENAFRLRQIYQASTNIAQLAQAIYGPLRFGNLQVEKSLTSKTPVVLGHLRKKDWNALKWRRRLFLLRDNFLFIFTEDAGPKAEPLEVLRVDDALVRVMFEVQHLEDPVISVEIASKCNPFYLYLSADAGTLSKWKDAISRAAAYWFLTR